MRQVLADGVVTDEERSDLLETLQALVGGSLREDGSVTGLATRLPVDTDVEIRFDGRTYGFTGKFVFGLRARCARAVEARGAAVERHVTRRTDYLVVRAMASRDWVHTSHGRKIERALELKSSGASLFIVVEEHWAAALG